jgi:hypothetical protein
MKREVMRTMEEHIKSNFIVIDFFLNDGLYSFSVITSIVDGGIGHPTIGAYGSFQEAKQAALRYILKYHKSGKQRVLLKKFKMLKDVDQPYLFENS